MYTWFITIHNLVFRPLRIGLGLKIPNGLKLWLIYAYIGVILTTYDTRDDPPGRTVDSP